MPSGSTVPVLLPRDVLAACFAPDYRSEFPAHPDRASPGHEQLRWNRAQIFGGVPDLAATLVDYAVPGDTTWWCGTGGALRATRSHVCRCTWN